MQDYQKLMTNKLFMAVIKIFTIRSTTFIEFPAKTNMHKNISDKVATAIRTRKQTEIQKRHIETARRQPAKRRRRLRPPGAPPRPPSPRTPKSISQHFESNAKNNVPTTPLGCNTANVRQGKKKKRARRSPNESAAAIYDLNARRSPTNRARAGPRSANRERPGRTWPVRHRQRNEPDADA